MTLRFNQAARLSTIVTIYCLPIYASMRIDDIKESALMAFDTLRANKLRSALTILGVSVGVVTVIFMVSIIQGLNKAFADQIESLGSIRFGLSKFDPSFGRPPGHGRDSSQRSHDGRCRSDSPRSAFDRRRFADPSQDCRDRRDIRTSKPTRQSCSA